MPPKASRTRDEISESAIEASIPVASRPAVLLWIRQLKLGHEAFVTRLSELESSYQAHDDRLKGTEAAAMVGKTIEEAVKLLASRMAAMEEDNEFIKESTKRFSEMPLKKAYDEDTRRMERKLSALDKRLESIEDFCQKQMEAPKGAEPSLEANDLKRRLDKVELGRAEEKRQAQTLEGRLTTIEKSCQDYQRKNNELQIEVTQLRSALAASAQPLPSVEARADYVQVPASPIPMFIPQRGRAIPSDVSPSLNAQRRKTARTLTHTSQQQAQIVPTQMCLETQSQTPHPSSTPDNVVDQKPSKGNIQNTVHTRPKSNIQAKRKRIEAPSSRKSRRRLHGGDDTSQAPKPKRSLIVKLKTPLQVTPALRTLHSSNRQPPASIRPRSRPTPTLTFKPPFSKSKAKAKAPTVPSSNTPSTHSTVGKKKGKANESQSATTTALEKPKTIATSPMLSGENTGVSTKKPPRKRERRIIVPVDEKNKYCFE
ncbi:hypothetical protein P154DRAFT_619509 [Amniculicola lignicola CBS 123094]|uniref:Uncharacterized protein n=1 Tax=Amniculicola lignicola CBS 123094 TaxID=1392246 RepID=A0A6A5WPZ9_9PLEO|nr:hypothetical protein P154DRAFT_619509 [Amniculicola lignicola CBS 123094]